MRVHEISPGGGLIGHLEASLGAIQEGWSLDADGHGIPFQVVRFRDTPSAGATTFATLGLSAFDLRAPSGRALRLELMFACHDEFKAWNLPVILQQLGTQAVGSGDAYLRGQCVGPRGPLFPGSRLEAIYCALPVYWPDSLSVYRPANGDAVQLIWAVPLLASEAHFISDSGWSAFESRLMESYPDLLDLNRAAVA